MASVIPRYVFVIDWDDQLLPLFYDHPYAITPIDFSWDFGSDLVDFSRMVGLRGAIRVHDPEGALDPVTKTEGSPERQRLGFPHRFWMYALDTDPVDSTIRQEGFAVVDRRPDKDHASIRLVSKEFVRLRDEIRIQPFNTYYVNPPPPPDPRGGQTPVVRPQSAARVNSIQVDGFEDENTRANLTVFYKNGDPDPLLGGGFVVTNIYIEYTGQSSGALTVPVSESPTSFQIPVIPGGVYVVSADVLPELDLPYVAAPFTVPGGVVTADPTISLSVTRTSNSVSIIATVANAPGASPMVDFELNPGGLTRESAIADGQAFAQYSELDASTSFTLVATIRGTEVSAQSSFTTPAAPDPDDPDPDPDPDPGTVTTPRVEIEEATFTAQREGGSRVRISGRVVDLNSAGGTLAGLTIVQNYRTSTSNTPLPLDGATTDANGNFSSSHSIDRPDTSATYVANAVVMGGSVIVSDTFSFTEASVAPSPSLNRVTATPTGSTTARLGAVVSSPTSPGQVWLRYRRQGTTLWTTLPAISRAANVGIVSADISGLSPLTSYEVQGSITSSSTLFTRSATFTTPAAVAQMSISFAGALNIQENTASVVVRISNVPEGAAPVVSFRVGGRNYSAAATLSQFAGWQASFNVAGLSAGTPYSFTVTARAGAQTDTDNVSFMTDAPVVVVREASITKLRVLPVQGFASVTATIDLGTRSNSDLRVRWSYFRTGSIQSVDAGESAVSAGSSTGSLSGLGAFTTYTARAELLHRGIVVDAAVANFTTLAPPLSITFDFDGGVPTNFGTTYRGLTSISVAIDLGSAADIDHVRTGLDPTRTYSHTAARNYAPGIPSWNRLDGLSVTARGPGGTITITYGDPGGDESTRAFYRARGWTVGSGPQINMSRTFGPGTYT